jgi:hypothetical protein
MLMKDMADIEVSKSEGGVISVLQFHRLRHLCITRTVATNSGLLDCMALVRVSDERLLATYNHTTDHKLRAVVEVRDAVPGTSLRTPAVKNA